MPSLNFQQQFVGLVSSGQKRQTIRATRKRPIKVGDTLHLFTGMRTTKCRKLGTGRCTACFAVEIGVGDGYMGIDLEGRRLSALEARSLAQADGFPCVLDLLRWFQNTHGLPFRGHVMRWVLI